ncbi:hypothetical protein F511_35174 [Dorcoceras hygrometricum]|uniref:Uncharacterized protein n=1 Tax=Dorcoceras hygrometricum TaxID=472368 RepID=A0A2Z7AD42_9LAMI|nr:hypothetical protein F511_35174 [Dorcoceras hygrometricum]
MPPRRDRSQQGDATPQLTPYERASMDMLAGITRLLERQSERPGKSHEEDVAERFHKQGPKKFACTIIHWLLRSGFDPWRLYMTTWGWRTPTRTETTSSACTRSTDEFCTNGFSSSSWPETIFRRRRAAAAAARRGGGGGGLRGEEGRPFLGIQLAVGPQPLRLRNHNSGLAQRIMVKRLATSPHDPLGITDSAYKNQSVVVSVKYGPFNPYITIRSTTIGKSRVAKDPIAMHTSWRSNSDIASVTR